MTGPIVGTSTKRRHSSLERWKAFSFLSSSAMRGASSVNSWPRVANSSWASAGTVLIGRYALQQRLDVGQPLGCNQAELGGMAADGVAQLRASTEQAITRPQQHLRRRLLGALHRYEPLPYLRPAHRLADRGGIDLVVLVEPDVGLDVLRRQHHHHMAQRLQLARPMVRGATRLQADLRRPKLGDKRQELAASNLLAQHRLLPRVDAMKLKQALRCINAKSCYRQHGRLPLVRPNDLILAHRCRWGPSTPTGLQARS